MKWGLKWRCSPASHWTGNRGDSLPGRQDWGNAVFLSPAGGGPLSRYRGSVCLCTLLGGLLNGMCLLRLREIATEFTWRCIPSTRELSKDTRFGAEIRNSSALVSCKDGAVSNYPSGGKTASMREAGGWSGQPPVLRKNQFWKSCCKKRENCGKIKDNCFCNLKAKKMAGQSRDGRGRYHRGWESDSVFFQKEIETMKRADIEALQLGAFAPHGGLLL